MIQHPDERPKDPTPEQAERFRSVVDRIMKTTVSDGSLHAERVGENIGFTIEESRLYPLTELNPDDEKPEPVTIFYYHDFILLASGKFEKHVTFEEQEEKEKREKQTGVVGAISRNKQDANEHQILDPSSEEHATRIVVERLNGLVDLGKVNPIELDTGMAIAEEILYDLE